MANVQDAPESKSGGPALGHPAEPGEPGGPGGPGRVMRAGPIRFALPLANVVEVMRPLPIHAIGGVAGFVAGASIIRGEPIPVVNLAALLERAEAPNPDGSGSAPLPKPDEPGSRPGTIVATGQVKGPRSRRTTTGIPGRFVVLRVPSAVSPSAVSSGPNHQPRRVALAVEAVLGIGQLGAKELSGLPALLQDGRREWIAALGAADEGLLLVLRAGRIVPDDVWPAVARG